MTPAGFGALCARHPAVPAARTCSRCGNFMCDECSDLGQQTQCPSCRELAGTGTFPFSRNDFDFGRVWAFCYERFRVEWAMLSVCVLILFAVSMAVGIFGAAFRGIATAIVGEASPNDPVRMGLVAGLGAVFQQVVQGAVQGVVQMGLYRVAVDVLQGKKADTTRLFSQVSKVGRFLAQYLIQLVLIGGPVLVLLGGLALVGYRMADSSSLDDFMRHGLLKVLPLFVLAVVILFLPLIYVSLGVSLASHELMYSDCSATEALSRSWKMVNGFRLPTFGFGFMAGLVTMAGVFACCVGVIPASALAQLLMCGLFLSLRNGSGLPPVSDP
ncbi:MAG: hypothetical protein K1X89_04820 [Myxococcaceae bacterium]|nr:hypothetical protein [Myxococcaceae bacterium]